MRKSKLGDFKKIVKQTENDFDGYRLLFRKCLTLIGLRRSRMQKNGVPKILMSFLSTKYLEEYRSLDSLLPITMIRRIWEGVLADHTKIREDVFQTLLQQYESYKTEEVETLRALKNILIFIVIFEDGDLNEYIDIQKARSVLQEHFIQKLEPLLLAISEVNTSKEEACGHYREGLSACDVEMNNLEILLDELQPQKDLPGYQKVKEFFEKLWNIVDSHSQRDANNPGKEAFKEEYQVLAIDKKQELFSKLFSEKYKEELERHVQDQYKRDRLISILCNFYIGNVRSCASRNAMKEQTMRVDSSTLKVNKVLKVLDPLLLTFKLEGHSECFFHKLIHLEFQKLLDLLGDQYSKSKLNLQKQASECNTSLSFSVTEVEIPLEDTDKDAEEKEESEGKEEEEDKQKRFAYE